MLIKDINSIISIEHKPADEKLQNHNGKKKLSPYLKYS